MKKLIPLSALLVLTACGGGANDAEVVVVPPVDTTPPTLTAFADLTLAAESTSAPISFTASDDITPTVGVSATSSDQRVIADSDIEVGLNALTVTALADSIIRAGTADITVTAFDAAGNTATQTFTVTITPNTVSGSDILAQLNGRGENSQPLEINALNITNDVTADEANAFLNRP